MKTKPSEPPRRRPPQQPPQPAAARPSLEATPVPLPPEAAFVLQLPARGAASPDLLAGRVEHVTSGRATRFASLCELLDFIRRTLTAQATRDPGDGGA